MVPESKGCLLGVSMAQFRTNDAEMAEVLRRHLKGVEQAFHKTSVRAQEVGDLGQNTNTRDLARLYVAITQGLALAGRVQDTPSVPRSIVTAGPWQSDAPSASYTAPSFEDGITQNRATSRTWDQRRPARQHRGGIRPRRRCCRSDGVGAAPHARAGAPFLRVRSTRTRAGSFRDLRVFLTRRLNALCAQCNSALPFPPWRSARGRRAQRSVPISITNPEED